MSRTREVVSVHDEALDLLEMGDSLAEWSKTRERSLERLLQGARPIVFHVEPVSTSMFYEYVRGGPTPEAEHKRAFEICVRQIDNLGGNRASSLTPSGDVRAPEGGSIKAWSKRDLAALSPELSASLVEDIGAWAWSAVFFSHQRRRHSPLPPRSRDAAIERIGELAVERRRTRIMQSTAATSQAQATEPEPVGDADGSVPATETPGAG
jgi:hypothetical protein